MKNESMKKAKSIKQLEAEKNKVRKQLQEINNEIEDYNLKKEIPMLKKKYEGKYWKYDNGCSAENRWWLYSFCRKVTGTDQGFFDSFETTNANYRQNNFNYNEEQFFHLCQIEISKEEYLKQFNLFQGRLKKLKP